MTKITTQFTTDLLTGSLGELRSRRAKLQAFITEAGELDTAIKEMERVLARLGLDDARPAPRLAAVAASPALAPRVSANAPVQPGSNHERALELLRSHPRGLNTSVIAAQANIASGSISIVLQGLVDRGHVVKVGRGFWRVKERDSDAA